MNSNSAVFLNNTIGNSFKTTVGVRQGCLLSPVLFNIFLERIMQDTLHQHSPTISIGGRPICNLRFADDIDLIAGSQAELQVLTDRLVASSKAFGMEVHFTLSRSSNSQLPPLFFGLADGIVMWVILDLSEKVGLPQFTLTLDPLFHTLTEKNRNNFIDRDPSYVCPQICIGHSGNLLEVVGSGKIGKVGTWRNFRYLAEKWHL
ncbi:endonuclease-reverse transcriptase [Elysia marginata]|uniref:Endonuclease-reverse transcriptase n=1 Tax=Elysia marginata TaxID=1093978 RepID=A0AAV4EYZ8_9GAST|nr:endonuclease-reverse transcriptase [Elysia marginata]